ncbi:thiamine biosynthesis lipoprotein [Clostridium acetobutylicum]|uniref:FAD:protein FMN transferase n=1 Tax=Clostridium acetobutylicum (strain ATCC 824 / DSM 792 / JCM 1419 / IAM 19013 / LMG 5710 / NBRC 13948 / NRRL B-527 / VKM B-1787 / 2291 / W) TaxID=272562 RepID=Q97FH3_CLOAB|nr:MULTISPECIES: FAD:protein FMN transferase [Clostridium]AAK80710.1 Thiamine biosynthesis lipoprotein ApbE [Clostridium acetobutylicum ATCC 824]ADZ21811.1 Thiamine biosynthesis lipoprotein ApbE [Clostridium acetobutylicum EA 2018]AEI34482.1 thiamine biosynthesis lipoprotein ApbE [Clostridium acetobutylicum DSM 1731]AWV78876.1 FAD:protein FMN transferase [Clostridium acetobutylicum]MBC2395113.1 FAD:protein FMN transferase [Clostridium acetobutylicum]
MNRDYVCSEMFCMGTIISQKIYGEDKKEVLFKVENEMRRLEKAMNFYSSSSEISKLNKFGFENEIKLSKDVYHVIKNAKNFSKKTLGAFDISLAPIIKLWGIFCENERVPSVKEIEKNLSLVNYKNLVLNDYKRTVKFLVEDMKVDLGGIAKGYAADRAIDIYKGGGVKSASINLGGNVSVIGEKPDGKSWCIGVQNPLKKRGEIIGAISVKNKSVVTSGSYVRYFEKDNIKYHHIIDPKTGYPAKEELLSVTVIFENSMLCDAVSTAAFIAGADGGIELVKRFRDVEAIFITKDRKVIITKGIAKSFSLVEESGFQYL